MYNYLALYISIMTGYFPEIAFQKLEGEQRIQLSAQDYHDVLALKAAGFTWKEIAELYGLSQAAILGRIYRFQRSKEDN